jgi:hypothetical protein
VLKDRSVAKFHIKFFLNVHTKISDWSELAYRDSESVATYIFNQRGNFFVGAKWWEVGGGTDTTELSTFNNQLLYYSPHFVSIVRLDFL